LESGLVVFLTLSLALCLFTGFAASVLLSLIAEGFAASVALSLLTGGFAASVELAADTLGADEAVLFVVSGLDWAKIAVVARFEPDPM
jgi:hypothetical protein